MFLHWFLSALGSLMRKNPSWSSVYRRRVRVFGADPRFRRSGSFSLVFLSLALTACNNENISVYRIPKENNQVSMQTGSGNLAPPPPANPASWTKPDSWTEKALSEMRLGSFEVAGANGVSADVSITAFPGDAGGLDSNVNRWREQVHQPALESEQLAQSWQEEAVDGVPTIIVDVQSPSGAEKASAILGSVMRTADRTWFVKMTGPPALLKAQKDNFLHFVRSFHFPSTGQPKQQEQPTPNTKSTNDR